VRHVVRKGGRNVYSILIEKLKGKGLLEDLVADGKKILEWNRVENYRLDLSSIRG